MASQHVRVPDDEHPVARPRQRHVDAVVDRQETHSLVPVGSHQGDDDDVVLLALEVVHGRDGDVLRRQVAPQLVLQETDLSEVRRENGYLRLVVAALDEVRAQCADEVCLEAVGLRVALALIILEVVVTQEKAPSVHAHDLRVVERGLVVSELRVQGPDEPRDLRVHPPLLQQRDVLATVLDQALEERDVEVEVLGQPVDRRRGPQLLVVTDEDHVLRARVERRQDVGLQDLRGLFHDDHLRPQLLQQDLVLGDGRGGHPDEVHLTEDLQLPVALERGAVEGIPLELPGDLRQQLSRLVVGLQQPLPVGLLLQVQRQAPEVLLAPVQAPELRPQPLIVLLHEWQPRVLELSAEVSSLLHLLLLHIQLPVVLLVFGLLLFLVLRILAGGLLLGVLIQTRDRGGGREATSSLGDYRSQFGEVTGRLQPGTHHLIPHPLVPLLVFQLVGVLWKALGPGIIAEVVQVTAPEAQELRLRHERPHVAVYDVVPLDVRDNLVELFPELVAPLRKALPGVEELPGGWDLPDQLLEVPRLQRLALRAGANTRDPLAEAEDALEELIQGVVGEADNEHGRMTAVGRVVQQGLHDLEADPRLPRSGRPLDQGHLVRDGVLDGV
mmetsp:Transcript_8659/g.27129  ORF Transcript_8659/g.27129 Transcript_8659/m.27129 type:complete len:612 (+) Transcript_8659:989-2824(+)